MSSRRSTTRRRASTRQASVRRASTRRRGGGIGASKFSSNSPLEKLTKQVTADLEIENSSSHLVLLRDMPIGSVEDVDDFVEDWVEDNWPGATATAKPIAEKNRPWVIKKVRITITKGRKNKW